MMRKGPKEVERMQLELHLMCEAEKPVHAKINLLDSLESEMSLLVLTTSKGFAGGGMKMSRSDMSVWSERDSDATETED